MRKLVPYIVLLVGFLLFAWALISLNARKNTDSMNMGGSGTAGPPASSAGDSANSQEGSESLTVKDQGEGNVEVTVTYVTPGYLEAQGQSDIVSSLELDKNLAFAVVLNTHSVELSGYEVDKISYLRDEDGKGYPALSGWLSAEDSGHHRSGIIRFAKSDSSGNPILKPGAKYLGLVIKDLAGVAERTFRWKLPLSSEG
jgi:hypothetical protein